MEISLLDLVATMGIITLEQNDANLLEASYFRLLFFLAQIPSPLFKLFSTGSFFLPRSLESNSVVLILLIEAWIVQDHGRRGMRRERVGEQNKML